VQSSVFRRSGDGPFFVSRETLFFRNKRLVCLYVIEERVNLGQLNYENKRVSWIIFRVIVNDYCE